jgi:hypothetical protein
MDDAESAKAFFRQTAVLKNDVVRSEGLPSVMAQHNKGLQLTARQHGSQVVFSIQLEC